MLYSNIIKNPKSIKRIRIGDDVVLDEIVEVDPENEEELRKKEEEDRKREEFEKRIKEEVDTKIQIVLGEQGKKLTEKFEQEKKEQYSLGFKEGEKTGIEEGKEAVRPFIEDFLTISKQISDEKSIILHKSEKNVITICYLIAKKIIKKEIEKDDKIILNIIRGSLNYISGETRILLKLNPEDYNIIKEYEKELTIAMSDIKDFSIEANEKITRGGYLIETDSGDIDARLETKIDELERVLLKEDNFGE